MAVTPGTIAIALGRTSPLETHEYDQWEMWISDAEMLIQARVDALGHTEPLDEAKYEYVVREAVVFHVRRPDDATQVTVSIQDASTSKSYSSSRGRIDIRDEWWLLLGLGATAGKAFEVNTMPAAAMGEYGVDYWWSTPTTIVDI